MLKRVYLFKHKGFDVVYAIGSEKQQLLDFDKDDKLFLIYFQKIDNFIKQSPEIMISNLDDLENLIYQYSDYINNMNKRVNWAERYVIQFWAGGLTTDLLKAIEMYYSQDEYDRYLNRNYCEVLDNCNFNCLLVDGRTFDNGYNYHN